VVGAHLDSRMANSADPSGRAPGADDNGSGTSAIMELARVFTSMNYTYAFSVQFLLFSGEEQVRRGAAQARAAVTVWLTRWSTWCAPRAARARARACSARRPTPSGWWTTTSTSSPCLTVRCTAGRPTLTTSAR